MNQRCCIERKVQTRAADNWFVIRLGTCSVKLDIERERREVTSLYKILIGSKSRKALLRPGILNFM